MLFHGTIINAVRRLVAAVALVVFASLNAVDAVCCADGCTHDQPASADQRPAGPDDSMCILCMGGIDSESANALSPGCIVTDGTVSPILLAPDEAIPDPLDHPPRT